MWYTVDVHMLYCDSEVGTLVLFALNNVLLCYRLSKALLSVLVSLLYNKDGSKHQIKHLASHILAEASPLIDPPKLVASTGWEESHMTHVLYVAGMQVRSQSRQRAIDEHTLEWL